MAISKSTTIGELLVTFPESAPILMEMVCIVLDARHLRWSLLRKQLWFMELMQICL